MTPESIAFNIYDTCNMSGLINDGELYPAYKVHTSIMAEYLKCNAEDLDDILMNVVECYFLFVFIEMMTYKLQLLIFTKRVLKYLRYFDVP